MCRKIDVKEKFHHRKKKRIKETISTGKRHFVELKLRNRKKNIKLKYHTYSISKLKNEINGQNWG